MFRERHGFCLSVRPRFYHVVVGAKCVVGVFHLSGRFAQRIIGIGSWRQVEEVSFDSVISECLQDKFKFPGQFVVVRSVLS
jgi:hypothetical protein